LDKANWIRNIKIQIMKVWYSINIVNWLYNDKLESINIMNKSDIKVWAEPKIIDAIFDNLY
jgi:hypothetical protein